MSLFSFDMRAIRFGTLDVAVGVEVIVGVWVGVLVIIF